MLRYGSGLLIPTLPFLAILLTTNTRGGGFLNAGFYFFWMDTWFYWTHRYLHTRWAWRNIHYVHHALLMPTAFAQDAVHPLEAILQGPSGHHLSTLFMPMHPILLAIGGFSTSFYAIAAHDGRQFDLNDHMKHHTHKHVNYGLYWGFWDNICNTRYDPKSTAKWQRALKDLAEDDDSNTKVPAKKKKN